MSEDDSVFLATGWGVEEVADRLKELLGLGPVLEPVERDGEVRLRGRAVSVEGWLGFLVHRNWHVLIDPEPGEAQAIDPYLVQVDVWYDGTREFSRRRRGWFSRSWLRRSREFRCCWCVT